MKIYISGKISGLRPKDVRAIFNRAAYEISLRDNTPINPLENGLTSDHPWILHMMVDLWMLKQCDAIFMLPNWRQSRGAIIEFIMAKLLRKQIFKCKQPK